MKHQFFILPLAVTFLTSCYSEKITEPAVQVKTAVKTEIVAEIPLIGYTNRFNPVRGRSGMVSTSEAIATQVGADILAQGGNAVDAAVAVGFALAVTYPQAGNLGGGGFMIIHMAKADKTVAIDYREMAPKAAFRDMYLDENGNVDKQKIYFSRQAAGVPGTVAGMMYALKKYGTMTAAQVITPAYKLAKDGVKVGYSLEGSLGSRTKRFSNDPGASKIFLHGDGSPYKYGEILVQSDLAWTLKHIMENGRKGFYQGEVAQRFTDDMAKNDGIITKEDLKNYTVVERKPIMGTYKNYTIATMPPPSSGGIHLVQMMNMLEHDELKKHGHNSARNIHLMIETMRQAYADRSEYLGDSDFTPVPIAALTNKKYAAKLRAMIPLDHARNSADIKPALENRYESPDTTHFSVMDKFGNVVSNTYTLNFSYGSGIVAAGTGVLLNNEMDDFSAKPGVANVTGLLGGEANKVEPHKRPLSSMTPTIVFKDGKALLATGSPGSSTIITTVLQTVLNVIEYDMNIAAATAAPRIHHQWYPEKTSTEMGVSIDTVNILSAMGHKIESGKRVLGSTQSIMTQDGVFYGASDPRRTGAATIGVD